MTERIYSGGDGYSMDRAIIINANTTARGITAEYDFITSKCGQKDLDWTFESQMAMRSNGRNYDYIKVKLKNEDEKSFYFDITQFYGKF